jgi:hypothetical protein
VIEVKLTQQLALIEQAPFYGVFINLKKAFDTMDCKWCLFILEGHGMGPSMRRLIRHFWDKRMPCLGELHHAFQDSPWCDSGWPAFGQAL